MLQLIGVNTISQTITTGISVMQSIVKSSFFRATVLGLGMSMIGACATSEPTIDTSADAEVTFDGLHPVKGGRMDAAWARADFSLEPYSKVILNGVGVEYRPGGANPRGSTMRSTSNNQHFDPTPEQRVRFEELMGEAFEEEMARGEHFEIVTEPGPDVLLISGGLLDVVSFIPPDMVGRGDIFLSRVGEATLILEMRDSVTGAILVRAIDRRAAEDAAGGGTRSNRVSNTSEFRRLARTWARILRESLDRFMAEGDEAGE
jgi:hypothetical protein